MEVRIAVSKIKKYASSDSGDTVEVVERPHGGVSIVLADGQSSGRGAKWISTFVVRKAISLLAEGVRDGAAARAASDSLFTEKKGKVSATLNIISVDRQSGTLVITRNNPSPALLARNGEVILLDEESIPIGLYRGTRPVITELPIEIGLTIVAYTDGLVHAGKRIGQPMDAESHLKRLLADGDHSAKRISDALLEYAMTLDQDRPADDISIVVMQIVPFTGNDVRSMTVRLPLGQI